MPNNKIYIILILFLVVFLGVMFLVFGDNKTKKDLLSYVSDEENEEILEKDESLLIVGDTTWLCQDGTWSFIRNKADKQHYNGETFRVYDGIRSLGNYYLKYDDKWVAYDAQNSLVKIEDNLLAYSSNREMKVWDLKENRIEKDSYIEQVLQKNQVPLDSQFSSIYKIRIDYDQDSVIEDFYIISNAFPIGFEPEVSFSMAFMVKNNQIYDIYTDVSSIVSLSTCKPYYSAFLDTNGDGIAEVVLSCGKFSATERIDMLYQFKNDYFKMLISNK